MSIRSICIHVAVMFSISIKRKYSSIVYDSWCTLFISLLVTKEPQELKLYWCTISFTDRILQDTSIVVVIVVVKVVVKGL